MKLARLSVENFRGLEDGDYDFVNPSTGAPLDLVVVTGGVASGKTSFLEAIGALKESVGGYGLPPDRQKLLRRGAVAGRIAGTWVLSQDEQRRAGLAGERWQTAVSLGSDAPPDVDANLRRLLAEFFREPTHGKVEYVPAQRRLVTSGRAGPPPLSEKAEGRARLARDADKYAMLLPWLVEVAVRDALDLTHEVYERGVVLRAKARDSLAPVKKGVADLLPHLRLVGLDAAGDDGRLVFEHASGARLTSGELSEAEQQAVLLSAVFHRLALHHSIVLLDTPELGVAPEAQPAFLRGILGLGSDNQLFVATSSATIVGEAPTYQIVRLRRQGGPA